MEIKFSVKQLQCGSWKVYRLPGKCFSEGKVKNKAGFSELSASSQHLGETYLLRTPKNWGWLGRGAIKGYTPALLLSQPPKEILSSLFKGLKSLVKTDSFLNKDY